MAALVVSSSPSAVTLRAPTWLAVRLVGLIASRLAVETVFNCVPVRPWTWVADSEPMLVTDSVVRAVETAPSCVACSAPSCVEVKLLSSVPVSLSSSLPVSAATWVADAASTSVNVSAPRALSERPRNAAAEMPVICVVGESA